MIKPPNQVIRDSKSLSNLGAPDTPTKTLGSGDVATDIVCATYYEGSNGNGGKPRDIIGLMSMDGVLALHDMKNQTARVHDLDSTHKIFGFSKLNFGRQQQRPHGIHPHHHISQRHQHTRSKGRGKANQEQFHLSESSDSDDDVDSAVYGRSTERLSSLKYSPRHRREYERLKKRAKKQQQEGGAPVDQILEGDESPMTGHGDNGNGDDYDDDDDDDFIDSAEQEEPSLLVRHPSQPALQNDIFVGCSWSGITFFIDQDFNTAQYDFESRVCAFGAGEYAIFPGKNEPCLFYVDFDDNIYVYYNFHIHLEPSIPFDDVVKTDTRLYQATKLQQKALHEHQYHKEDEQMEPKHSMADKDEPENGPKSSDPEGSPSTQHATDQQKRASTLFEPDSTAMTDEDLRGFIHDSLYNANRYEDEYRELKRLLEVEEAKKRAVLARMKAAEREAEERRQVRQHMKMAKEEQALMLEHQARVLAFAQAQAAKELPHQQPQQQQQQQQQQQTQEEVVATEEDHGTGHGDTAKDFEAQATTATTTDSTKVTSGAAAEESGGPTKLTLKRKSTSGSLSSLAMTSPTEILAATKIPSLKRLSSGASGLSSLAPSISSAPSSATTTTATASTTMVMPPEVLGRRRGSLLIRDVLASYEGKKTPPLVLSPTATSPPSSFFAASTTAESRPTSMAMATVTTPILKRQSSSSSTHRAGEDVASHLPPLAPTTAGPAATATATGLGTATTSVMATNASGNSSGGGGGSEAHPTRKHSGSQGGSSGHRRTTGDGGTHAGNGGTGPRYHHSLSSGQQAHGHVLTSLMKRLNIKDLGHAGRLVHPPSVVSANDAAVFGPGASQGSTSHDQDQASAAEPGSMASSHGSASSSLSSASTATIRNSGGSGSIGYGHGRVIAKSTKSYFYHHHHGRPLTPGGHRSHGIAVGHRGGSVGRRMSVRSRLLLAQQQQQQQQSLQRDEAKHPTHHEEAESGLEGGHSSVSGKQDGTSDVFGEAVSPTNAGDRGDVDSESKQPTTRSGGPISVERSRTPDTSRPGSQSNSRRSSQGAVAMSTTATGIGEFSLGDTATRAAAAAAAAMAPSFDVQAAEMVVGQGCINSEGERAESVEGGRGEDSSDSCSGGMHTPSTISPIPSPGRADESDEPDENVSSTPRLATVTDMASVTSEESSPSVERAHEFELAKSLLSPPSRPGSASSGSTATLLASTATATASKAPACTSTSINTATATSAGGSMSMGIIEAGAGTSTMNDPLDGRRSRAE
ncbi:integrin alpha FG-GAP repeat-containing protein 2 [Actinomortierella ambigua]|nr:integrin alpha FG-GAP repeat-containing protein 2 [Actinomortierella ambigua]